MPCQNPDPPYQDLTEEVGEQQAGNPMPWSNQVAERLKRLVGAENVLTEQEDLLAYSYDGTAAVQHLPDCVVFAHTVEHVQGVLRLAMEEEIPIVTRGSGSGLSGGSIPIRGGIVLCMTHMNRILELDRENLTLLAEAGATTQSINDAAEAAGLFYPPDPASMSVSTIGGNVSENSGGLRGLKYGVTRNYVMGLEVVLPKGEVLWVGNKCVKDVAGYSVKDLFIGSEGTLGVITKVLLRLVPKPQAKKTLLATYERMDQAAQTVSDIIAAKIIPCTLEFLDRTTIHCVDDFAKLGLPRDCEALLLMETDGHPAVVEEEAAKMVEIARKNQCKEIKVAQDEAEALGLAAARRTAFSALARVSPTTILEDVTVPRSRLAEMVRFIQQLSEKYRVRIGTFGHMGDGNLHPTFLTDERNKEEMQRVEEAFKELFDKAIELGGTITGEHGVGIAKKGFFMRYATDPQLEIMRTVKRILDPKGLLNPGKMFD